MLLMIDNYDSFTYNLVQYFGELGVETQVFRNDQISIQQIADLNPDYLVISCLQKVCMFLILVDLFRCSWVVWKLRADSC